MKASSIGKKKTFRNNNSIQKQIRLEKQKQLQIQKTFLKLENNNPPLTFLKSKTTYDKKTVPHEHESLLK